ncbi:MAG TPA: sigma factor-like helix-turn-helix DNA-binding protein [Alphaproteobacteria bacterium]|nr:sigma factor-like helix-turn-helix DNA-binding protein [Alphaproteobacteria bacterium]
MRTRSQKLVQYLPELRRYARALLGSRQSGDAQLRVMLEALLQSPDELSARRDVRRELFRFFHTVVHTLQLPFERAVENSTDRRLRDAVGALPLRHREALLLTSLSGFDTAEAAGILGITKLGVERALAHARDQIRHHLSARILIVDDQRREAERMEQLVEKLGHSVVGVVPSGREAVEAARDQHPEIVLADLHGQGSGRTEEQLRSTVEAPVVSVRKAHPRRGAGRRAAARADARRRVSARDVGDAITDALATPRAVKAHVLRG